MTGETNSDKRLFRKLGLALLFIVPLLLILKLALEATGREPLSGTLDIAILSWIHHYASPMWTPWVIHLTNFGGPVAIIGATLLAAATLFLLHKRQAMAVLLIGVGGAAIIDELLKLSFHRVRPTLFKPFISESSFSFPSGHAMLSSALAFSIILLLWKTKWRWYAVVIGLIYTLLIGFSRLYLGVHYPTDVLAGWLCSFVWLLAVKQILTRRQLKAAGEEVA